MSAPRITVEQATAEGWFKPNTNDGYCHCNCGGKTKLAMRTDTSRGYVKGQPLRFVSGHHHRVRTLETLAKMSEPHRGKPLSPEHRAKLSAANARRSPETLARIFDAMPRGASHPMWKGGRWIDSDGYVQVHVGRDHEMSKVNGYVCEHRLVMSEAIGRPLTRDEVVHHVNGVKDDNRIENLMLFATHAEHVAYEHKNHRAAVAA